MVGNIVTSGAIESVTGPSNKVGYESFRMCMPVLYLLPSPRPGILKLPHMSRLSPASLASLPSLCYGELHHQVSNATKKVLSEPQRTARGGAGRADRAHKLRGHEPTHEFLQPRHCNWYATYIQPMNNYLERTLVHFIKIAFFSLRNLINNQNLKMLVKDTLNYRCYIPNIASTFYIKFM